MLVFQSQYFVFLFGDLSFNHEKEFKKRKKQ